MVVHQILEFLPDDNEYRTQEIRELCEDWLELYKKYLRGAVQLPPRCGEYFAEAQNPMDALLFEACEYADDATSIGGEAREHDGILRLFDACARAWKWWVENKGDNYAI